MTTRTRCFGRAVPIGRWRNAGRRTAATLLLALCGSAGVPLALAQTEAASAPQPPASSASAAGSDDPLKYIAFSQDFVGLCVTRNGVQILVTNTHPTRTVRVWLDRYFMGTGTGDRSRSDLPPHAEPEPLGCSRTFEGPQEWRIVKAVFVD